MSFNRIKNSTLTLLVLLLISGFITFNIKAGTSSEVINLVDEGESLINQKKYDEAIKKLELAIEKDPAYGPAYYQMGRAYHYTYNYEKAIGNYKKAYELDPSYGEACYNTGSCYSDIGNFEASVKWLEKAKEIFYNKNDLPRYKRTLEKLVEITTGSQKQKYLEELNNYPPPTVTPFPTETPVPEISPAVTPSPLPTAPEEEMILVPAGKFLMGSNEKEIEDTVNTAVEYGFVDADRSWFVDEFPQHEVYLDSFYIDKYEVTNKQFDEFVTSTGYKTDGEREGYGFIWDGSAWKEVSGATWQHPKGPGSYITGRMDHPVVQVSWNDAIAYALWSGKRLPTEAEWEKACRGTDGAVYPWGDVWNDNYANSARLNLSYLTGFMPDFFNKRGTIPVGKIPSGTSPSGSMDMIGNVWEWCSDWYSSSYYYDSPDKNPGGPETGDLKVLKGGSWYYNNPAYLRSPLRLYEPPDSRNFMIGFRCAKDL